MYLISQTYSMTNGRSNHRAHNNLNMCQRACWSDPTLEADGGNDACGDGGAHGWSTSDPFGGSFRDQWCRWLLKHQQLIIGSLDRLRFIHRNNFPPSCRNNGRSMLRRSLVDDGLNPKYQTLCPIQVSNQWGNPYTYVVWSGHVGARVIMFRQRVSRTDGKDYKNVS